MSREPDYFVGVLQVSDKFHESNHTTCSCTFRSTMHSRAINWNTSGAEQVNSQLQKKAKSFRCMNLKHAVNGMTIFAALLNANSNNKARVFKESKLKQKVDECQHTTPPFYLYLLIIMYLLRVISPPMHRIIKAYLNFVDYIAIYRHFHS
jgi:hypothetical protein